MTAPIFPLYFTCLLVASMAHVETLKESSLHFESVNVGESVTLPCSCEDGSAVMFYWYKQTLGRKPNLMSTFYRHNNNASFHEEFKNNQRFSLKTEHFKNDLKISDLQISDSATYYCVGSNLYDFEFCNGTTVSVEGSGLSVPVLVHQSSSDTIQPGGSVTLNCTVHTGTCDGEHSVYWFKNSEDSHPGLIYTHGGKNDQCQSNKQTHSCAYNLPMKSLNLSHNGTYYCAVVSCGHILFGDGTKLEFEDEVESSVLVYFLSGALTFMTILVVLLALSVYKVNQRCSQCTEHNVTFSATSNTDTALFGDADNLHYAALRGHNSNRPRRQRDSIKTECVYSGVKQ